MRKHEMLKFLFVILNILLLTPAGFAQGGFENRTDSLLQLYNSSADSRTRVDALNKLSAIYIFTDGPRYADSIDKYSSIAIDLALETNYQKGLARAYYMLGKQHLSSWNNPAKGTQYFLSALDIYQSIGDENGVAVCYMQLGLISYMLQYYTDALKNLNLSIKAKETPVAVYLAALSYTELDSFKLAKQYFSKSIASYIHNGDSSGLYESYMYLGRLHLKTEVLDSAFHYLNSVVKRNLRLNDHLSLIRPYAFISEYYLKINDVDKAIYFAEISFESEKNRKTGSTDEISSIQNAKVLSEAYAKVGNYKNAHYYLELYNRQSTEFSDGSIKQKVANMQSMFEFEQKMNVQKVRQQKDKEIAEAQIAQERIIRNFILVGAALLLLLLLLLYNRYALKRDSNIVLQEKNQIISEEKKRSDDLLLNILPEEVAEELKTKGEAEAQLIDQATVLFTDFKGFTAMSEVLSPKDLVNDLNVCFSEFDRIIGEHNIEKIKTIGDAYMAAGGLPTPNQTHALDVVQAAFKMRDFVEAGKAKKIEAGLPYFEIRIGVHTGPVVAGIVGVKKFQYDIWGDTVNTASRMESAGEVGKVNVSKATYELLMTERSRSQDTDASAPLSVHNTFTFESRGNIEAKGKGEMEMWFVSLKKTKEFE
jgi:adenylate cyclase